MKTMMNRRFTKEELEEALKQIRQRHKDAYRKAEKAIGWLVEQGIGSKKDFSIKSHDPWCINVTMVDPTLALTLTHQTYGPYLGDFTKRLDNAEFAKNTSTQHNDNSYEVKTPFGTYSLGFEYFDNHYAGF